MDAYWKADGSLKVRHFDYCSNPVFCDGEARITHPSGKEVSINLTEDMDKNGIKAELGLPLGGSRDR